MSVITWLTVFGEAVVCTASRSSAFIDQRTPSNPLGNLVSYIFFYNPSPMPLLVNDITADDV